MNIIDLHQDVLMHGRNPDVYKYKNQTSIEDILESNIKLVFGTGFVMGENQNCFDSQCLDLIHKDIDVYTQIEKENECIHIIRTQEDIDLVLGVEHKKGIIIHIEGLNTFVDTSTAWAKLELFYTRGLRSIGMMWSRENSLGGGDNDNMSGLTELGAKVVTWANMRGVLIDYAHMNERTFFDTTIISKSPIFISHGNARRICDNKRNYTDEQLQMVQKSGGIIGIFFANSCLVNEGLATISDVVAHILYIKNLIGIDHVSIGSDLGGLTVNIPEGLRNVFEISNLEKALEVAGLSVDEIEKILFRNAIRFLKENLGKQI